EKQLKKGFRNIARVPRTLIERSFGSRPLQRCVVTRADGAWVHGRDHDEDYATLAGKVVVVVGCGALGSAIARLLAQAGVGNFRLIDDDILSTPNTARHALGHPYVGKNKAKAVAQMLRTDFPHLRSAEPYPKLFEHLTPKELESLTSSDLVISAALDYSSDLRLDSWRREYATPPAHVCTWFEEFAIVGHAVAIIGADTLLDGFDTKGRPHFRLTDWPPEAAALITEAGCGNMFQPYGAVDIQTTVALAARMALDILLGANTTSRRRVWQGSCDAVIERGGKPSDAFKESFVMKDFPWHFD
ncbi:MAG: ThiF family adenylyltransferase, partial [Rudaea sp.]